MTTYLTNDTELTATANAIRSKAGTSGTIQYKADTGFADAVNAIPVGGGTDTVAVSAFTKITNKTSMQNTNSQITIPESGTWKLSWFTYCNNSNTSFKSQLYKGSTAVGSSHQSAQYSATLTAFTETLTLNKNDVIMVKAQTRSGSSYYICVIDLIAEKQ